MKIVLTPNWFLGGDVLIEIFSFLILLLFSIFSVKSYKLSKNKNSLYLGLGFLLIAVAELATTITKFVLYYDTTFTQYIGHMAITYHVVKSVDIFYYIGFFFNKLLTLFGLFIIYRLPGKKISASDLILIIYFILVSAIFSYTSDLVFHLTAILLLAFIIECYSEIYKKNKSENTINLIIAFSILALSHVILIFATSGAIYVFAQIVQLVSYIILLVVMINILKHGGKKKK